MGRTLVLASFDTKKKLEINEECLAFLMIPADKRFLITKECKGDTWSLKHPTECDVFGHSGIPFFHLFIWFPRGKQEWKSKMT